MSERLVKWRLFFVWEEDKEERWLEEMARQGWHMMSGGVRFVFGKGEPADIRYRLDWRKDFPGGRDEYFAVFHDAGWEYVDEFKHWYYFRCPATSGAPDIYTDVESRMEMYRRIQRLLAIVIGVNVFLINYPVRLRLLHVIPLQLSIILFLVYGVVRLRLRMNKLRATGAR